MQNASPAALQKLIGLADTMANGLTAHGPWIGVAEIPGERLRAATEQLRDVEAKLAEARKTKVLATQRVTLSDKALHTWLAKARLVVMLARGTRWSESWTHAGFTSKRTTIPKRFEARLILARTLVSFFARHPEFGVAFAEVTAARGRELYERAMQSREMLEVMTNDCAAVKQHRDAAENALREMMRQTTELLNEKIEDSDPRRPAFGLKQKKGRVEFEGGLGPAGRVALKPILFVPARQSQPEKVAAA